MKPIPDTEITGTASLFNLEGDSAGAVLVVYTEDENGEIGRSWIRFDKAATRTLKASAVKLPDFPSEEAEPAQEGSVDALPPRFVFGCGAPLIGGSVVAGDVHGVSGGTVHGDVHLGGQSSRARE